MYFQLAHHSVKGARLALFTSPLHNFYGLSSKLHCNVGLPDFHFGLKILKSQNSPIYESRRHLDHFLRDFKLLDLIS